MKRRRQVRREGQSSREDTRVRRTFVDPSNLKASELKALVCLYLHGKPAPFLTGHAFTREVTHPSINATECIIPWQIVNQLSNLQLAVMVESNVILTGAGKGIGRSLSDKPILGYD